MRKLSLDDLKFFPAIPFAFSFCCGILFTDSFPQPLWYSAALFLIALFFLIFLKFKNLHKLSIPVALIAGFGLGSFSITISNNSQILDPFHTHKISDMEVVAEIDEFREMNQNKISFTGFISIATYDSSYHADSSSKKQKKRVSIQLKTPIRLIFSIKDVDAKRFFQLKKTLLPGKTIQVSGIFALPLDVRNPGGFDYAEYLKREAISGSFFVYADSTITVSGVEDYFEGKIYELRQSIGDLLDQLHDPATSAILKGLIIADRSEIDEETVNSYIDTGIAHILAVSGFNVGIIYLLTLLLFQKIKPHSRYFEIIARITVLFLFLLLTQFQITVTRAVVMFTVHSLLTFSGRATNRWNTLSICMILLLVYNPQDLFSTSFQLSVTAVASLFIADSIYSNFHYKIESIAIEFSAYYRDYFVKIVGSYLFTNLTQLIIVSFFVQLFMLPFLLIYFEKITLLSLPANIMAVPLSSLMLINGLITLFASLISTSLAHVLAAVSELLNQFLNFTIQALRDTNWGMIELHNFSVYDGIVFYLLVISLIIVFSRIQNLKWRTISLILATIIIVTSHILFQKSVLSESRFNIIAIDVGQGDCYLLKDTKGRTILIDAGVLNGSYDAGKMTVLPTLKKMGIDSIDAAFISHYDVDHAGGMISILRSGIVKNLYLPQPDSADISDLSLSRLFSQFMNPTIIKEGSLQKVGDFIINVLEHRDSTDKFEESNRRSVVLKISVDQFDMMFTGDLDKKGERDLIENNINLNCDLLKVSHHGSNSGSSDQFLDYVSPKIALISAGVSNRYNHPHPAVLGRLEETGCTILRTDLEGCIILEVDEQNNLFKINWR